MNKQTNELTGLEKGLFKIKNKQEWKIEQQEKKLDSRTRFTIDLLKDNHTKLKEFYVIGDFWIKGYRMTELKEYTNKKGVKSMKHYVGEKYINPQPKSKEAELVFGWGIYIDATTIELYDIDDNGMLKANKEKFQRYWEDKK
tara:strand:- start:34 stop:459 length:426 start_codon:yes stop_codon:yes gene_type:complete